MAQQSSHDDEDDRNGTASYIAAVTAELAEMARSNGFPQLGYILEMAKLEAEMCVDGEGD